MLIFRGVDDSLHQRISTQLGRWNSWSFLPRRLGSNSCTPHRPGRLRWRSCWKRGPQNRKWNVNTQKGWLGLKSWDFCIFFFLFLKLQVIKNAVPNLKRRTSQVDTLFNKGTWLAHRIKQTIAVYIINQNNSTYNHHFELSWLDNCCQDLSTPTVPLAPADFPALRHSATLPGAIGVVVSPLRQTCEVWNHGQTESNKENESF